MLYILRRNSQEPLRKMSKRFTFFISSTDEKYKTAKIVNLSIFRSLYIFRVFSVAVIGQN